MSQQFSDYTTVKSHTQLVEARWVDPSWRTEVGPNDRLVDGMTQCPNTRLGNS